MGSDEIELPRIWDTVPGSACDKDGLNCCYMASDPVDERHCTTCGIRLREDD